MLRLSVLAPGISEEDRTAVEVAEAQEAEDMAVEVRIQEEVDEVATGHGLIMILTSRLLAYDKEANLTGLEVGMSFYNRKPHECQNKECLGRVQEWRQSRTTREGRVYRL